MDKSYKRSPKCVWFAPPWPPHHPPPHPRLTTTLTTSESKRVMENYIKHNLEHTFCLTFNTFSTFISRYSYSHILILNMGAKAPCVVLSNLTRVCCWDKERFKTKSIFSWFVSLKEAILIWISWKYCVPCDDQIWLVNRIQHSTQSVFLDFCHIQHGSHIKHVIWTNNK